MPEPFDLASMALPEGSEVLRLIARHPDLEALAYRDGEYLIREEEASQDIFLVLQGALVVEQAAPVPGGAPAVLACLGAEPSAPAIVGEMAYLGDQRRAASVKSSGRTRALRLRPAHVDAILEGCPELTRVICRQFSRRLIETDRALRALQARFALDPGRRMAQAGEVLFAQGGAAGELFQLVAGSVRLDQGGTTRIATPENLPHGLLEPEAYLRRRPHAATATVVDMAFLAVIGPEAREAAVRTFPDLVLALLT